MLHTMTAEQRLVAKAHHNLVYAFLKEHRLPDEYYDIVVFGYLCAVQAYCESLRLRKYKLSTVAWKEMQREVFNYRRHLHSKEDESIMISLQEPIKGDNHLRWEDVLHDRNDGFDRLRTKEIMWELASRLPRREMRIVRRRLRGDRMHDIAKAEHMTFREINRLLERLRQTVMDVIMDSL